MYSSQYPAIGNFFMEYLREKVLDGRRTGRSKMMEHWSRGRNDQGG